MDKEKVLYTKEEKLKKLLTILKNYDTETASHCLRVGLYTSLFLKYLKDENQLESLLNFSEEELKNAVYAACVHDIGKIYVHPRIIIDGEIKTDSDILEIKEHTKIGTMFFDYSEGRLIYEGILYHHERFDGEGYPERLRNEEIPVVARLLNLMDSYDAMTTKRPYMASAKSTQEALDEIKENLGTQFDPLLGEHFLRMFEIVKYEEVLIDEKNSPRVVENLKTMVDWLTSERVKLEDLHI